LAAGERELLLDDLPGEHEPGMVVPGGTQVAQGRGGVEAGKGQGGQTLTARIDPQRGGAGQDADPVAAPDRVPVADPLGVVPPAGLMNTVRPGRRCTLHYG